MTKWRVNMLIEAPDEATAEEVAEFITDLEWCGGCRDPENDPMVTSVKVLEGTVKPGRQRKKRLG